MNSIFLSHAAEDTPITQLLYDNLIQENFSVWVDTVNMEVSTPRADQVKKAIQVCDVFIAVISPTSATTAIWYQEWKYAERQRKFIVPIMTETFNYPAEWKCYKTFNLSSPNQDFASLVRHLRALLSKSSLAVQKAILSRPRLSPEIATGIVERTISFAIFIRKRLIEDEAKPDPNLLDQVLAQRLDISVRFAQLLLSGNFPETEIDDDFLVDIADSINAPPDTLRSILGRLTGKQDNTDGVLQISGAS